MKKLLLIAVLLMFLAGCVDTYYVEDNEKSIEMFQQIYRSKKQLKNEPDNHALRTRISSLMFNLELERARAAGVREGNEPFFINKNSNISVLLIHGFTASPDEIGELGLYLASKGYNVYGTLLAGHGTDRSELRKTKWRDWYESVKKSYEALNYISDKIFVVGVSTGGSLGIILAEDYKVDGIVCLACPVDFTNKNTRFIPLIKHFYWYEKRELKEEEKPYYYEYRPLESIEQLDMLISHYTFGLKDINSPIMVIQNKVDPTVDPESAGFLYEKIGSYDKQKVLFDGDYHVLTKGEYKEEVFDLIDEFIYKRKDS